MSTTWIPDLCEFNRKTFAKKDKYYKFKNKETYINYLMKYVNLAINLFEWKNLPETMDERFLEYTLCMKGYAILFEDEEIGPLSLQCMIDGKYNVYNIPTHRIAYANNGYERHLTDKNSVIVFNNYNRTNTFNMLQFYAAKLADIERTIDTNLLAQKTPVLILADDETELTLKNEYDQFVGNRPVIIHNKATFSEDSIKVLKTDAPFTAPGMYDMKGKYHDEVLTYLGIESSSTKKERLVSEEAIAAKSEIEANRLGFLNARQQGADMANRMFGYDIKVSYRLYQREIDDLIARTLIENMPEEQEEKEEIDVLS